MEKFKVIIVEDVKLEVPVCREPSSWSASR